MTFQGQNLGGGSVSYYWDFGAGANPQTSSTQIQSVTYSFPGTKDVKFVIVNTYGCADTVVKQVFIEPLPEADFNASSPVCAGDTVFFTNNSWVGGSGAIKEYQWYFGDGSSTTSVNTFHQYSSSGVYNVTLVAVSDYNCTDTMVKVVTISAPTVPGSVVSNVTVCYGNNSGVMTLTGYTGSVQFWEYSPDGGVNWYALSNTSNTQPFQNLTQTTMYRAYVKNGGCPGAYSTPATVYVDPMTNAGTLLKDTTVCASSNSGTLNLTGYTGNVVEWYASTDWGNTWVPLGNTSPSYTFSGLTDTTIYKAVVKSGVCPYDTSNTVKVEVSPGTVGGTLQPKYTVCQGSSGVLHLVGYTGQIQGWSVSSDGGLSWINIANATDSQAFANIQTTTLYQVTVQSGVCPAVVVKDTVKVDPMTNAGTLLKDTTVCASSNSGTLNLTGYTGNVVEWYASTDWGNTWVPLGNTSPSYTFSGLTDTTIYKAVVKSGVCPYDTSNTVKVEVSPGTVGGTLQPKYTVCQGSSGVLHLVGYTGQIQGWSVSSDGGLSWINIANATDSQAFANIQTTTLYQVTVQSGVCPAVVVKDTVKVDSLSRGGVLGPSAVVCLEGNSGTLYLTNYYGNIVEWYASTDGVNWTSLQNSGNSSYTYNNLTDTTTFIVVVKNGVCPSDTSSQVTVYVEKFSSALVYPYDTVISLGDTVILTAGGGDHYQWFPFYNLSDSSGQTVYAFPYTDTTYYVIVTDRFGCRDTARVSIKIKRDYKLFIQNLITPNGDGYNDTWFIGNIDNYPDNEVIIFDIYGDVIYRVSGYTNANGWDGTYNGKKVPDGTYYFIIRFPSANIIYKGRIDVISSK